MRNEDEYEDYFDDETDDYENTKEKENYVSILSILSTWFIRIGIVIAIILTIVFLVTGKLLTAFFYIIGLLVAFLFGYGFMYLLDHLLTTD